MGPVWLYNLSPSLADDDDHSHGEIYDDHDGSEGLEPGEDIMMND